jgi:hypothetical protein
MKKKTPNRNPATVYFGTRVPRELIERLRKRAALEERTLARTLTRTLTAALDRLDAEEKQKKES